MAHLLLVLLTVRPSCPVALYRSRRIHPSSSLAWCPCFSTWSPSRITWHRIRSKFLVWEPQRIAHLYEFSLARHKKSWVCHSTFFSHPWLSALGYCPPVTAAITSATTCTSTITGLSEPGQCSWGWWARIKPMQFISLVSLIRARTSSALALFWLRSDQEWTSRYHVIGNKRPQRERKTAEAK